MHDKVCYLVVVWLPSPALSLAPLSFLSNPPLPTTTLCCVVFSPTDGHSPHCQTLRPPVPAVNKILYREHALTLRALRAAPVAPFTVPAGHALDSSLASASYDSAAAVVRPI